MWDGLRIPCEDSPEKLKDRVVNLRNKLRERLQKTEATCKVTASCKHKQRMWQFHLE